MYRYVAVWVTQQMYLLFEDFHHRAFEVFLYGTLTICEAMCRAYQLLSTDYDLGLRYPGEIQQRGRITKRDS